MTKKQIRDRRREILRELTRLSYLGWDKARREDWQPLEDELNTLTIRG